MQIKGKKHSKYACKWFSNAIAKHKVERGISLGFDNYLYQFLHLHIARYLHIVFW